MFRKPETDSWIVASPVGQTSLEWPRTDSIGEIGLTPLLANPPNGACRPRLLMAEAASSD